MKPTANSHTTARPEYRFLAGLIGAAMLLVGLPVSVVMAIGRTWDYWSLALCCLVMGYGFLCILRTGELYVWRRRDDRKDT
jgi:hypothetical protein